MRLKKPNRFNVNIKIKETIFLFNTENMLYI
jgi:hypothetical protein